MELTVISGKGGTGKTMVAVALAELLRSNVQVDCDVDAPNLYLYYKGTDVRKEYFYGERKAEIDARFCTHCGECENVCRFEAITDYIVDPIACEGCGACVIVCPAKAVALKERKSADIYLTRTGDKRILSRAQMEVGAEGSGKLITQLRRNARRFEEPGSPAVADGSPGVGCQVISSVTAADMVLIVTEPTQSGFSDFERVAQLCSYFGMETAACINKYDVNPAVAEMIENRCRELGIEVVGRIPYDDTVMRSINELMPITHYEGSPACGAVKEMAQRIEKRAQVFDAKKDFNED